MADPTRLSDDLLESGRKLFAGEAVFVAGAATVTALPSSELVEVAFAGRSNVGKSSLINALTGRKALARTSRTPGRTQELNLFRVGSRERAISLVDMPGHGFAAVEKTKLAAWTRLIHAFLRDRPNLARVFLLVDARHGLKPVDDSVLETLDRAAVSYQAILTKSDTVKPSELAARRAETQAALARRPAAFPDVLAASSLTGTGIPELRGLIAQLLVERSLSAGRR